ncbi:MAG: ParB N-terminal domain-containing protein [Spirochaetota bacterium]|nr:ParB N-terminal domain-containing protein [Spirochaetota bacterium]
MKIHNIIIKHRIRKDLGDLSSLKQSIEKYGLLHPIIINKKNELISGERRLTAVKELGWEDIDVITKDLSYKEALNVEILENTTRKNFDELELIEGLKKHQKYYSKNIFVIISIFFQQLLKKMFSRRS